MLAAGEVDMNDLKTHLMFSLRQTWQRYIRLTRFSSLRGQVRYFYVALVLRYSVYALLTVVCLFLSLMLFDWLGAYPVLLLPIGITYFYVIRALYKLKAHEYQGRTWPFYVLQLFYLVRYVFYGLLFVLAATFIFGNMRGELVLLLGVLRRWRGDRFAFGTVPLVAAVITFFASPVFTPLSALVVAGFALYYGALGASKVWRRTTYRGRMLSVQEQILEELRKKTPKFVRVLRAASFNHRHGKIYADKPFEDSKPRF
jgi:hypothetical protein